jgi:hypothetical protein
VIAKKTKQDVKVELVGGLGNQLFGLFFALAVSTKLNCSFALDKTLIGLGSNSSRKLELEEFQFSFKKIKFIESKLARVPFLRRSLYGRRVFAKMALMKNAFDVEKSKQKLHFKSRYRGYFQDWVYADYISQNSADFSFTVKEISDPLKKQLEALSKEDPVLVHVRLGDYLKFSDVYQILPEQYYLNAIKFLNESKIDRPVWLIIEDISEVKSLYPNLVSMASRCLDKKSELLDYEIFYLMANSKQLVASNSTFSLWAAWFISNKHGEVVVPSEFLVSGVQSKLIDSRWNQIDLNNYKILKKTGLDEIRRMNKLRFDELFV